MQSVSTSRATTPLAWLRNNTPINAYWLLPIVAAFLVFTGNSGFFAQVAKVYPLAQNLLFTLSLGMVLFGLLLLIMWLVSYRFTLKAVLIFLLIVASITGYFTDTYGTVYDTNMLQNALQTDKAETSDLFNIMFIARIVLLGLIPSFLVARQKVYFPKLKSAVLQRLGIFVLSLVLVALPILAQSKQFATFFREHKPLRLYTNPVTPICAVPVVGFESDIYCLSILLWHRRSPAIP